MDELPTSEVTSESEPGPAARGALTLFDVVIRQVTGLQVKAGVEAADRTKRTREQLLTSRTPAPQTGAQAAWTAIGGSDLLPCVGTALVGLVELDQKISLFFARPDVQAGIRRFTTQCNDLGSVDKEDSQAG